MITEPDASGGLGSYSRDLWGVLTGALEVVAAPALGRLLDVNTIATVGTDGVVRYAATPSGQPSATEQAKNALSNPLVLAGLIAAGIVVVVMLATRR